MPRKKKRTSSLSSDEEEDDIPLKVLIGSISHDVDPHSYDSLCMPSNEPCELCDQVSSNKYNSLIHNVRHIIIPLLNQKVCQCEICLHHFTSQNDLKLHVATKHTLKELVSQTDLIRRNFNNCKDSSYESDLISIIKEEKEDKLDHIDPDKIDRYDKIDRSDCEDTKKNIAELQHSEASSESFSLKSRLMFEEDIISLNSERLLSDLTTDCQVKVELFPPIWGLEAPKSVGYEELVKPGVFRCKKCGKSFPNRYEAIIHEARHINIKTNISNNVNLCKICNIYIVGDYSRLIWHKTISHRKQFFGHASQNGVKITTSLKLCGMCFSFYKNNYNCFEELREEGRRFMCDKCGGSFFDIYLVKREVKCSRGFWARKKKKVSNEDRLKIIQKRLKLLRKIYFVVLFTYISRIICIFLMVLSPLHHST